MYTQIKQQQQKTDGFNNNLFKLLFSPIFIFPASCPFFPIPIKKRKKISTVKKSSARLFLFTF